MNLNITPIIETFLLLSSLLDFDHYMERSLYCTYEKFDSSE